MNRSSFCVPIIATLMLFVATQRTKAASYSGTVLYSMAIPAGYTIAGAAEGQTAVGPIVGSDSSGIGHALLWTTSGAMVDLNPSAFDDSQILATNGAQQVGSGEESAQDALLWSGSAASVVDLSPTSLSGIINSQAIGISGTQQVGVGYGTLDSGKEHALLWSGTASSAVDLNPTNLGILDGSVAIGTNSTQQVGYAIIAPSNFAHAILWSGTAASAVDLNPSGITDSQANGLSGNQQVGQGSGSETGGLGIDHALLWTGTAASATDLNPTNLSGYTHSSASATNGISQVGGGSGSATGGKTEALLWSDTANSAINLQILLPSAGSWTDSIAWSIDATGNIFGTADGTYNGVSGTFAVEWSPVPEPGTAGLLALGALGILFRSKRRTRSALRRC
jgi:PEP-CTERM motif